MEGVFRIVSVGRITKIKKYEVVLDALVQLKKDGIHPRLTLVGSAVTTEDEEYATSLQKMIRERDLVSQVVWVGSVSNTKILPYLYDADVFVNAIIIFI